MSTPTFATLARNFLAEQYEEHPVRSSGMGLTQYDDLLDDLSGTAFERRAASATQWRERFAALPEELLTADEAIDRDLIVVVLQNSLTPGERYLADDNRAEQVLGMRRAYQDAMSSDCIASIEDLTGRTVLAFMSANHIDPDLAAEVFILKPETNTTQPAASTET